MPIIKSASKKMRRDVRRQAANLQIKTALKKLIRAAHRKPAAETLRAAQRALDKAAKTGLVHRNKAARLKSRIARASRKTTKR